jgi:RNA polymerase sigma-70 factor, ECF subfamily
VLRKPRILRSEDDLGYLLRVLRNTFIVHLRTASRRPQTTTVPEEVEFEDPASVQPLAHMEAQELYAQIAALPEGFRDAIVAVDVLGLSYAQAARAVRVGEPTLTTRLYRARQRVAREIAADFPDRRPGRRLTGDS